MKTRMKGKAIIGIAMAVIMFASVFAAMISSTGAYSTGGDYNIIIKEDTIQTVLIGQDLRFMDDATSSGNWTSAPAVDRVVDNAIVNTYATTETGGKYYIYNVNWPTEGAFYVNYTDSTTYDARLSVEDPNIPLILKVGTKTVSSIALGTNLTIDTGGINLFSDDKVDLVIMGPDGQIKSDVPNNPVAFTSITVGNLASSYGKDELGIETDGWKIGSYTFKIKTKPEYACGLEKETAEMPLRIVKGEISIKAEKTSVSELETIKLTVTGIPERDIWVGAHPTSSNVIFPLGVNDNPETGGEYWVQYCKFNDTIDDDSTRTYAVYFNDTGSYTIKVYDRNVSEEDTVDITVTEKAVTFDVPTTVVIGEKLKIKGTSNAGEWVQIAVDDYICDQLEKLVIDENGEFEKEIDTSDACEAAFSVPGSVRLKAFIDKSYDSGADVSDYTDDGSMALLMTRGDLMAEVSTTDVAQDDEFTISGTAKGSKEVDIVIVAPKGAGGSTIVSGGTTLKDTKGLYHTSTSVSTTDDTFSKKIDVGANVDTGTYLVLVFSKGSDDIYGQVSTYDTLAKALAGYSLTAKTQEQILTIIEDATYGAAGSDDLMWLGNVKVSAAYVTLDPIASVGIGDPLVVTGTTNRKDGFAIVVTVKGPVELTPQTIKVENGKFNATIDTSTATEGTYTVKADDGDGHTDDATVEIVTGVPVTPTPEVTPTPVEAVTPTVPPVATPTPIAEEPTPTPTEPPGFEAVFAIAGLLAVAYLVLRKRSK